MQAGDGSDAGATRRSAFEAFREGRQPLFFLVREGVRLDRLELADFVARRLDGGRFGVMAWTRREDAQAFAAGSPLFERHYALQLEVDELQEVLASEGAEEGARLAVLVS